MQIQGIYKSDKGKSIFYTWSQAMHTRIDLVLCNRPEVESKQIAALIYEEIGRIEKIGNRFDPESELSVINRMASQQPVRISPDLYDIINLCLEYNKLTLSCFDISIHSEKHDRNTISSILLSPENQTVYFQKTGIILDLSGFLKGYALEKIRPILSAGKIDDVLVNFGNSSVMAIGNHPFGKGWKIEWETLDNGDEKNPVTLFNECFTTSGNNSSERRHIINPPTGEYVEGLRKVSVLTDNAITGEVLSTALFVATTEQREELIRDFQCKAFIIMY